MAERIPVGASRQVELVGISHFPTKSCKLPDSGLVVSS